MTTARLRKGAYSRGSLTSACALLVLVPASAFCQTVNNWTAPVYDNWLLPQNWSGGIPTANSIVRIANGETATASILAPSSNVQAYSITVGYGTASAARGSLEIFDRATLTTQATSYIGSGSTTTVPGASGVVSVLNAARWQSNSDIVIGHRASGTLNIRGGSVVSCTSASIGDEISSLAVSSRGTVTVEGADSQWNLSQGLTIGNNSSWGVLNIRDGGRVTNEEALIGRNSTIQSNEAQILVEQNGTWVSRGNVETVRHGKITLQSGGTMSVGNGSGILTLGSQGDGFGSLFIGSEAGTTAPGTLLAGEVHGGTAGTSRKLVQFNHNASNYTFAANLTGHLVLQHLAGTTIATGTLSHYDASNPLGSSTQITSGILQLGNGGTTGNITNRVTVGGSGTLAFNRSDNFTCSAEIRSGGGTGFPMVSQRGPGRATLTGPLGENLSYDVTGPAPLVITPDVTVRGRKFGSGTLLLTGMNQGELYATITQGTLQIGEGGTVPALVGGSGYSSIAGSATLAFHVANNATFTGQLDGQGSLKKLGTNDLTLSNGYVLYIGPTEIAGGRLIRSVATDEFWRSPLTGPGTFVKDGPGRLIFDQANHLHTGGTIVNAGILDVGGVSTPGNFIVNAGATLEAGTSSFRVLAGSISGAGNFSAIGGGTTYLDGRPSHTGTTTVGARVELAWGGSDYSLSGPVAINNSGRLVKSRDNTLTLTANVSGGAGGVMEIVQGKVRIGDGGTTGTLGAVTVTLSSGGTLEFDRADATSYAGQLSGAGELAKSGAGTLTLSAINFFSGQTTLRSGILNLGHAEALGSPVTGGLIKFTGGTLQYSTANNADYSSRFWSAAGQAWRLDTNGRDVALGSNLFSDGGTLTKLGAGVLAVTGIMGYTGGTTIAGGTLRAGGPNTLRRGSSSAAYTINGGELDLNGHPLTISHLSGTGGLVSIGSTSFEVNQGGDSTWSGAFSGTGSLVKSGGGTLTLSGASLFSGAVTLNSGTLGLGHNAALGSGPVTINGGAIRAVNAVRTLSNSLNLNGGFTLGRSTNFTGNAALGNSITITSANPDSLVSTSSEFSGVISGSHALTFAEGANPIGNIIFSGNNTYSGGTVISSGRVQIGNGGATGAITGNVANNGTLAFHRSDDHTFSGNISGPGSVVQNGGGTLTLGGNNSWSGGLVINSGTIGLGSNTAAGTGPVTINGGGIRAVNAPRTLSNSLNLNNSFTLGRVTNFTGSAVLGNNITITSANPDSFVGTSSEFTGTISGSHALTFTEGANPIGAIILSGNNTYTGGTVISAGKVQIGNGGSTGSISGNVTNNGTLAFSRSDDYTFPGNITGSGILEKSGTGILTLTGTNSHSGGTVVTGGTLGLGGNSVIGSGPLTISGGGIRAVNASRTLTNSLNLNGSFILGRSTNFTGNAVLGNSLTITSANPDAPAGGASSEFSGVISGSHSLTFAEGANPIGTIILSGHNTCTGPTSLVSGKLRIDGSIAASSLTSVSAGATLGGSGTTGALTVNSGGHLTPGASPGTLTTGNLVLAAGSDVTFELGTASDLIAVNGTLNLDATINLAAAPGFTVGSFTLCTHTGARTGTPVLGTVPDGYMAVFDFSSSNSVKVTVALNPRALYDQWAAAVPLTGGNALPDAIVWNDGVTNLLKYAFNLTASGPDVSTLTPGTGTRGLPVFSLTETGTSSVMRMEFLRRRYAGLIYTPQRSTALGTWTAMTAAPVVTPIDADWERVVIEEVLGQPAPPRLFGTVSVVLP